MLEDTLFRRFLLHRSTGLNSLLLERYRILPEFCTTLAVCSLMEEISCKKRNFKSSLLADSQVCFHTSPRQLHMQSCVITGGNAGIGFATAVAMMRRGCNIILACRNMQKAENAVQVGEEEVLIVSITYISCDVL